MINLGFCLRFFCKSGHWPIKSDPVIPNDSLLGYPARPGGWIKKGLRWITDWGRLFVRFFAGRGPAYPGPQCCNHMAVQCACSKSGRCV